MPDSLVNSGSGVGPQVFVFLVAFLLLVVGSLESALRERKLCSNYEAIIRCMCC